MTIRERLDALHERGLLSDDDIALLAAGDHTLRIQTADKMIENVVGVLGLPLGLALNFLINGRDYVVPLCVEEPSIVAGLSAAARTVRLSGGFRASASDPVLIGQVQLVDMGDPQVAIAALTAHRDEILSLADSLHPKMVARGGGARDIELFHHHAPEDGREMVVLHLLVDTRDAMGANLVNTMCEGIASLVETITGGKVFLRILSNLTDRALARAQVVIPVNNLEGKGFSGAAVRDGIILATDLATVDPYRAATHNKGIMNGVDAVALATGNDWRAIEAAAHAYAARAGRYTSLTRWYQNERGDLVGEIDMPMKVGTVGGSLETNPTVRINHRLLGSPNAPELAAIMAAVGLAQNFAALRALSTDGIQQGHMTLHARSVATTAGVPEHLFDTVVEALIESGEIKVWKAAELVRTLSANRKPEAPGEPRSFANGKVILLGEHAVVYGRHAIAAPIPLAVEARVLAATDGVRVLVPRWGVEQRIRSVDEHPQGVAGILAMLLRELSLDNQAIDIEVFPHIPRAMGLGGSAALAVAIVRALDAHFGLNLTHERINALAFECEKAAHGTPSGVDNTVATYGQILLYSNASGPRFSTLTTGAPLPIVVGISGKESLTANNVAQVRTAWQRQPTRYDGLFDEIDRLTLAGAEAIKVGDLVELGELMNLNHGLLNALQLSTPELEEMIHIARRNGAVGAKLTGGGGGGSIIALCPESPDVVAQAIEAAGYQTLTVTIDARPPA
jgi:hydroxymethylglutaryl-CoA reductase